MGIERIKMYCELLRREEQDFVAADIEAVKVESKKHFEEVIDEFGLRQTLNERAKIDNQILALKEQIAELECTKPPYDHWGINKRAEDKTRPIKRYEIAAIRKELEKKVMTSSCPEDIGVILEEFRTRVAAL
jgi:hypothetical protein